MPLCLANSADPNEMPPYAAFSLFAIVPVVRGVQSSKGELWLDYCSGEVTYFFFVWVRWYQLQNLYRFFTSRFRQNNSYLQYNIMLLIKWFGIALVTGPR